MDQFNIEDVKSMLFAVKDIIPSTESKARNAVQKFVQAAVQSFPLLLETKGSKVFRIIRLIKDNDLTMKLKVSVRVEA